MCNMYLKGEKLLHCSGPCDPSRSLCDTLLILFCKLKNVVTCQVEIDRDYILGRELICPEKYKDKNQVLQLMRTFNIV